MAMDDGSPVEVRVEMPATEGADFINAEIEKIRLAWELYNRDKDSSKKENPFLIYRVPSIVREHKLENKSIFEPRVVAIGPFHHHNPNLGETEETKRLFAALFADDNKTSLEVLHRKILAETKDLRECYSPEDIKGYNDLELSLMFLLDGCAVLYSIDTYDFESPSDQYRGRLSPSFYVDLLLLENQLPYQVLQILIDSTLDPQRWEHEINSFMDEMVCRVIEGGIPPADGDEGHRHPHLLEKFRSKLLRGERDRSEGNMIGQVLLWLGDKAKDRKTVAGAKNLLDSGISLKSNVGKTSLRNISFHSKFPAILKMPILQVDDSTPYLFMNLIALEYCPNFKNPGYVGSVRSYLGFTNYLIRTPEDVKELRMTGMLNSYLKNDDDVFVLFRAMGTDLGPDVEIGGLVIQNIDNYCNSWFAKYFSSHWSILTFTGALSTILLSLVQTLFTIDKYLKADTKSD